MVKTKNDPNNSFPKGLLPVETTLTADTIFEQALEETEQETGHARNGITALNDLGWFEQQYQKRSKNKYVAFVLAELSANSVFNKALKDSSDTDIEQQPQWLSYRDAMKTVGNKGLYYDAQAAILLLANAALVNHIEPHPQTADQSA